jgi:hypothetical protein
MRGLRPLAGPRQIGRPGVIGVAIEFGELLGGENRIREHISWWRCALDIQCSSCIRTADIVLAPACWEAGATPTRRAGVSKASM